MEREKLISMVEGLKRGDDAAFDMLYSNFQSDIYYFILQKTDNDRQLAEDLTQETFIEVLESIGTLNEPVAFVSWIHTVASRKCSAYFRKRHELVADEDEDGYSDFSKLEEDREEFIPHAAMETMETRQIIRDLLKGIPDDQRDALILRYFRELSLQEIAEIQGVNEGTVKSRLHYGKKCLKKNIEEYEKKNDIKLHSVGVVPVLLWLFKQYRMQEKLSLVKTAGQTLVLGEETAAAAAVVTTGGAAAGAAAAGTETAAAVGAATAAAAGSSAAVQTAAGIGLGIAGKALTGKVVAGILAAVVAIGGAGAGVAALVNNGGEPEPTVSQEVVMESQANEGENVQILPTGENETATEATAEATETVETEPRHTHTYEVDEIVPPDCTEQGYTLYLCDCGDSYQGNLVAAPGHDLVETDRLAPVVGKDGYVEFTCRTCNQRNREVLPALTEEGEHYHVKLQEMRGATCTQDGYVKETCTDCGEELRYDVIEATGHDEMVIEQPSTCTEDGYTKGICRICGEELWYDVLRSYGHFIVADEQKLCTEDGYFKEYCTYCNEIFSYEVIPATGHYPIVDLTTRIPSGCTEEGYEEYYCMYCDMWMYDEVIPADGHNDGFGVEERVEPQPGVDGYIVYKCTCGETWKEVLPALPGESTECEHDWDYYAHYTDVLVYEDRTCKICGKYEVIYQLDNADCNHDWYYYETVLADIIHEMRSCNICGQEEKVSQYPNPCNHQWHEYTQEDMFGEVHTYQECTVCGYAIQLAN